MYEEVCENIKTAIEQGRCDVVRTLLEACVKLEADEEARIIKDKILNSPLVSDGTFLYLATKLNQGDVVRTLLNAGADPGVQNDRSENAIDVISSDHMRQIYVEELLRATANSEVGRVCQLIAAGININSYDSDESKNTPLHWAACYADRDMVSCLIDRGADVSAMNSCGATPLHDAVFRADLGIVEELLHNGANPLIQALKGKFAGKTPLDLAEKRPELQALVEKFTSFCANNTDNSLKHISKTRSTSVESFASIAEETILNRKLSRTGTVFSSQASLDLSPRLDQVIENLIRTHIRTPIRPLVTHSSLHLLWPQPCKIVELEGPCFVPQKELQISVMQGTVSIHSILDVWNICRPRLLSVGFDVKVGDVQPSSGCISESQVECMVNENLFNCKDSYQIHINSAKVRISAASLQALHYALCTFTQLLCLSADSGDCLVPLLIQDKPAMQHRGVLLDVSPKGRVPTMEYLLHMIDIWSSLKVSHLHLYTRLVSSTDWQLCYSRSEIVAIDRYCQDRFLSLVPVIDIDDSVTCDDITRLWHVLQEIFASFPNMKYIHLGPRLSMVLLHSEGDGDVERERKVQEVWKVLSIPLNVTVMLCCNGLRQDNQLCTLLPSNVVLVQYGFQADFDFLEWTKDFYQQGFTTCLSPGTASWNSLAGCPEASICNIYRAVQAVGEQESLGIVVAHWSGSYHLTPQPFSWPGFMVGAGLAWNLSTHWDYLHTSLADLLNTHIFLDTASVIGHVIMELGYAETYVLRSGREQDKSDISELPAQDGSTLYKLISDPDNVNLEYLSVDVFNRVTKHIKKCQNSIYRAKLECSFATMVIHEVQLTADLMLTACRVGRSLITVGQNPSSNMGLAVINLGISNLPPTFRTDIANKLLSHIEQYRETWLERHLPAGLQGSLLVLTAALHRFVPDNNTQNGLLVSRET